MLGDFDPEPEDDDDNLDKMFQPAQSPKTKRRQGGIKQKGGKLRSGQVMEELAATPVVKPVPVQEPSPKPAVAVPEARAPKGSSPVRETARSESRNTSNIKTQKASKETSKETDKPKWRCELLEESFNDLPDSKWKTLLRPYLCFL